MVYSGVEGSSSLRSGQISDSQKTAIKFTGLFANGTLTFNAVVDSEACCDKLDVYVDEIKTLSIQNQAEWVTFTISLSTGEHCIEWRFQKDSSGTVGNDAAWIDKILYTNN